MDKKIRQVETCRIFWQGRKDSFACGQSLSADLTAHWAVIQHRFPFEPCAEIHFQNKKVAVWRPFCFGRGARTRTLDTQFWRLVFYRLNYTPMDFKKYTISFFKMQYLFKIFYIRIILCYCAYNIVCMRSKKASIKIFIKKHLTSVFLCDILIRLISRCGGIGRRHGLKIRWEEIPVPVRVRSSAPYIAE